MVPRRPRARSRSSNHSLRRLHAQLRRVPSSPDQSRIERRTVNSNVGALKEGETVAGSQPGEYTSTATLDTTNVPPGAVNVSVAVTDVHGLSASCVASASVAAPPEIVSESLISDCEFNNPKKLARVD